MPPPVVAVVGTSKSGKTTVASALVRILSAKGYRVAAVKHCPHGHDIDRTASDTDRLYKAGAVAVIASSPGKRTRIERVAGLDSLVASFGGEVDLVIAEGFTASDVPKVLVVNGGSGASSLANVIATVGEGPGGRDSSIHSPEDLEELAAILRKKLLEEHGGPGD